MIDGATSLWTDLKNRNMRSSILKSMKDKSMVWEIVVHY